MIRDGICDLCGRIGIWLEDDLCDQCEAELLGHDGFDDDADDDDAYDDEEAPEA